MSWMKSAVVLTLMLAAVGCTTTSRRGPYSKPDELRRLNGVDEMAPRHPEMNRDEMFERDRDRERDRMQDEMERDQRDRDRDRDLQQQLQDQQRNQNNNNNGPDCPSCR